MMPDYHAVLALLRRLGLDPTVERTRALRPTRLERQIRVPPPSKDTVEAAIQSLRDDAQTWRLGAGELQIAANVAGEMDFQPFHVPYIGDKVSLTDSYRQQQDKLIALLGGAAANFTNIATVLTAAAAGYEEDEGTAV